MPRLAPAALAALLTGPAALAQAAPAEMEGPFPCDALALVALPDQADALGLTGEQRAEADALHTEHLRRAHELFGEIGALLEALHGLDRPFDPDETFALVFDLGRHQSELDAVFREGAAALLGVLTERQRARWDALVGHAAALETAGTCPPP